MSVYFDKSKNRWRIEITINGHRTRKLAPPGASKAEAQQWEAQARNRAWQGELGRKPSRTLAEAVQKWAEEELPRLKSEADTRNHAAQLLPYIGGASLEELPDVAERYKADHAHLAPATVNRRLAVLRRVGNLAHRRWAWTDQPLGDRVHMLVEKNARHLYLTRDEILALAIAAPHQHTEDAVILAAYTGMRLGEICKLKPEHVVGDVIRLGADTKTAQPRTVPIHPAIRDALSRLPLPVGKERIQQAFAQARAAIGRPDIHFHDLRHSFASLLVQAGVPLYTAGLLLGHASTKTTQRYAHLADEHLHEAMRKISG